MYYQHLNWIGDLPWLYGAVKEFAFSDWILFVKYIPNYHNNLIKLCNQSPYFTKDNVPEENEN